MNPKISMLVILCIMTISLSPGNVMAAADTEKPVLDRDSVKVSQTEAVAGDTVKIEFRVTDNVGLKYVFLYYNTPVTDRLQSVKVKYNNQTGKYEGEIEITNSTESGKWEIYSISATDTSDNEERFTDIENGSFTVRGTTGADVEKPVLDRDSVKVSQTEAVAGDTVKIEFRVTDNVGLKYVFLYYNTPVTDRLQSVKVKYNNQTGKYEGEIEITNSTESGKWEIYSISATDTSGNEERFTGIENGSFTVYYDEKYTQIAPLENTVVYTCNTSVSNTTLNGDVYIGPNAVVSLSNVKVNGNIYVLGGLSMSGIQAQSLYANSMTFSYTSTYSHGMVCVSGSNTFSGEMSFASDYMVDVPIRIDIAQNKDGVLNIQGATADIADMYINGININTANSGKFYSDNISIGAGDTIDISWKMYDGSEKIKKYSISQGNFISSDGEVKPSEPMTPSEPSTPTEPDKTPEIDMNADTAKYYNVTSNGGTWDGTHYYLPSGTMVYNAFFSDGTYTYYLQADGTPMKDRLTYHPDGVHVIYFDADGHEVFSDFAHISKSIAGADVDDMCFFNVYGYMYVDTLTYDKAGTKLYYVNPYGVLERNGWFQFSGHEFDAGLGFSGVAGGYGYANWDCSLMVNTNTYDGNGNLVYMQGDGHMAQ